MPSLFEETAEMLHELFDYNRENFRYDRKQRQIFEYQISNLRIDQAKLWREDVRDIAELTPQKMEVYLLVIALELGFCVMALCKGRVPAGAPPWLIACHTLSVCSAIMYLFLALWYGMHAFVSSQAYKVRILTQLVRLPVPTWRTIEAARTYSSAFEEQNAKQIVRVPFVMGRQEELLAGRPAPASDPGLRRMSTSGEGGIRRMSTTSDGERPRRISTSSGEGDDTPVPTSPTAAGASLAASDPWGLERRGDDIRELQPDVNTNTEKQKHIWLVREAARFFQTYDAFCRICMSAGTSSLATFFCYFCLSYVLTENAAPVAAWAGMCVFCGCALVIMRQDLLLQGQQYFKLAFLNFLGPALSGLVTFVSSKTGGDPGRWEYLMPFALLCHGVWLFYFIYLFRVREGHTGQYLPMAFRAILFLDAFAWAKHSGTWSKGHGRAIHRMADPDGRTSFRTSLSRLRSHNFLRTATAPSTAAANPGALPSAGCTDAAAGPCRPEDVGAASTTPEVPADNVSFRPGTFAAPGIDGTSEGTSGQRTDVHTGTDIQGEKPGLVPWRIFLFNTIVLGVLWVFAGGVAFINAVKGTAVFVKVDWSNDKSELIAGPGFGGVAFLQGSRVNTTWGDQLSAGAPPRPRGLACDPSGSFFATSGLVLPRGGHGILYGTLASAAGGNGGVRGRGGHGRAAVHFAPAPECEHLFRDGHIVQDLSLHNCHSQTGCSALVLTRNGGELVSCPLVEASLNVAEKGANDHASAFTVARDWLEDRGGNLLEGVDPAGTEGLLHPEELSSLELFPCGEDHCVIVGTTAQRVVQMSRSSEAVGENAMLAPWRLLHESPAEALGAGSLAALDPAGRLLAVLQSKEGLLRVVDVSKGGVELGVWRLQPHPADVIGGGIPKGWAAVCAGGGALFALEEEQDGKPPSIWRFNLPAQASKGVLPHQRM